MDNRGGFCAVNLNAEVANAFQPIFGASAKKHCFRALNIDFQNIDDGLRAHLEKARYVHSLDIGRFSRPGGPHLRRPLLAIPKSAPREHEAAWVVPDCRFDQASPIAVRGQVSRTNFGVLRIRLDSQHKGIGESIEKKDTGVADIGSQIYDHASVAYASGEICQVCIDKDLVEDHRVTA